MIKKTFIVLLSVASANAYDEYKALLSMPFLLQNAVNKYENESVIFYRSNIYPSFLFGKKKSDNSYIAYLPVSDGNSVRIMEKIDKQSTIREVNQNGECKALPIDTSAWEQHIKHSFDANEEIFLTGNVQKNAVSDYSVVEW